MFIARLTTAHLMALEILKDIEVIEVPDNGDIDSWEDEGGAVPLVEETDWQPEPAPSERDMDPNFTPPGVAHHAPPSRPDVDYGAGPPPGL
jgi:hypothetical protein